MSESDRLQVVSGVDDSTEKEALFRRSLIAKRTLKRQASNDDKKGSSMTEEEDEYFSIQPEKRRHKDSSPKRHHEKSSEERKHHDHAEEREDTSQKGSEDDGQIDKSPTLPELKEHSEEKTQSSRSYGSQTPKMEEGLSSSPDSFKDAAIPISPALSDTNEHKQEESDHDNDSNTDAEDDSDAEKSPKKKMRHIDDEDIKEILLDDLTEEQKSLLSPEQLRKLDERTQAYYISKLPIYFPGLSGCRSVVEYNCLNKIDEGTFGIVYRAQEKRTGEIFALKRLKLERERDGFPVTSLREVNLLLMCRDHPNVVNVKEIVVGNHMDKVYLVMEYVEHDLKALIDQLKQRGKKFTTGQIKTLTMQLLEGISFMHDNWMIHRDLKTSNLLLSHKGILKIGDFGLARTYGQPLKAYTPIVVTLWYRSPELLLGTKKYSTPVDIWSVGCIMAEFIRLKPLFMGAGEMDQIDKIFHELGTPSDDIWPGFSSLPYAKKLKFKHYPCNQLRKMFGTDVISETGLKLLNSLFIYDPEKRATAGSALNSDWFLENPLPTPPELFPTWPAKSEKSKMPPPPKAAPPPEVDVSLDPDQKALFDQFQIKPKKIPSSFSIKF